MAFSKNTSPLKKYGNALKPTLDIALNKGLAGYQSNDLTGKSVDGIDKVLFSQKQMAIWSHENEQVSRWGEINLNRYRWVRIEDFNRLIDEAQEVGNQPPFYHALLELLQTRDVNYERDKSKEYNDVIQELQNKPMGSHDHTTNTETGTKTGSLLKQKYGKWMKLATPIEIKKLEQIGEYCLKSFGYIPGGSLARGQARL